MTDGRRGLTNRQLQAVSRIAGLTVVNAMVFQAILASHDGRVQPLRRTLDQADAISAFSEHWQFILEDINYLPIFRVARDVLLALAASQDVERAVRDLADRALRIVTQRAALRHDLMGRIYHLLLEEAKYLGTYYTSVSAATMLLKLVLAPNKWTVDWSDLEVLSEHFRVGDLACGTGTLLMAAAEAMTDNYVRECGNNGQKPDLRELHRALIESILYGYDVLPSALHLTASTLAIRAPEISFGGMRLYSLPLGGPHRRLGSIEFLRGRAIAITADLFGAAAVTQVTGRREPEQQAASLPDLDLCVMNPPFTRSVGGNLLFGSLPAAERRSMQRELRRLLQAPGVYASGTAGLGSVFVAIGDRFLKQGGRMALVPPKALLSGVAWGKTRHLFRLRYRLEYVISSHDPLRWNFSDNTDLSEVLVVAQKLGDEAVQREEPGQVTCVNLWKNPGTAFEALAVAHALGQGRAPDLHTGQGALEIRIGDVKFGEAIRAPWETMREGSWMPPCAFAQSELVRAVHHLMGGFLYLPGTGRAGAVPLCSLGELGTLGPDRRDIHDGFRQSRARTTFPAFWGHDASAVTTLSQVPNRYLSPLPRARRGRPLRRANDLWPRAGRILIGERLWLKTQRLVALRLQERVLSNVWWPFAFEDAEPRAEKAVTLWLNSTLGLLVMLASREETRGAWVGFKKPVLREMPVLDVRTLSDAQLTALGDAYNQLCGETMLPFPEMAQDRVRAEIDAEIAEALGIPRFDALRELLAREPVVCLHPLS